VKLPFWSNTNDEVTSVPIEPRSTDNIYSFVRKDDRKHYLIDFFRLNYVWAEFSRAPWYVCLLAVLALLVDSILRTGGKYITRLFSRFVLNKTGLIGQYINMLTYSQASICSGKM